MTCAVVDLLAAVALAVVREGRDLDPVVLTTLHVGDVAAGVARGARQDLAVGVERLHSVGHGSGAGAPAHRGSVVLTNQRGHYILRSAGSCTHTTEVLLKLFTVLMSEVVCIIVMPI